MEVMINPNGIALMAERRNGTKLRMEWRKMSTDTKGLWMLILNDDTVIPPLSTKSGGEAGECFRKQGRLWMQSQDQRFMF